LQVQTLTKNLARRFLLAHQGLWPPQSLSGKAGVLAHIQRVGCIQFDPLNVVGNNSDLVLQARVVNFQPQMLQELLYKDRRLLDGMDKMMSIYPVEDWPFFRRQREAAREYYRRNTKEASDVLPLVRRSIRERGPLSSIDLDLDEQVDWAWAPTRIARASLESMYAWGELIIHHRVHTRKFYDFADRYIPAELLEAEDPNPTDHAYHDWHVRRRLGGVGLLWSKASDAWLAMPGIKSKERNDALQRLLERERIITLNVEGISSPVYACKDEIDLIEKLLGAPSPKKQAVILAPLDNLLWDRRFIEELFGFRYVWEVYKPKTERKYGYYVLPILYGDQFIARFEPAWEKAQKALIVKNWWWETGVKQTKAMKLAIVHCFRRFLKYLGASEIWIDPNLKNRSEFDWLN
jgi:uncharacterized protein YcaQ